jgi:hypothetical protein
VGYDVNGIVIMRIERDSNPQPLQYLRRAWSLFFIIPVAPYLSRIEERGTNLKVDMG